MYIYIPLCRYWIALYRYVLVFIVPHVDIELEDNKQFISNIPRISNKTKGDNSKSKKAKVVILVCDTSTGPALHFYQVS